MAGLSGKLNRARKKQIRWQSPLEQVVVLFELVEVEVHSSVRRLILPRGHCLVLLFQLVLVDVGVEFAVEASDQLVRLCLAEEVAVSAFPPADRVQVLNVEVGVSSLPSGRRPLWLELKSRVLVA